MDAIPGAGGSGVLAGRYEVGGLVGLGGTARVYRARDQVGDADVAVKIFPAGTAAGPNGDGSRELATLGRMRHPGLVGVRDAGVDDDGRPFVVMDLVDGQSLAARLRDGALPAAAVVAMGRSLADALAHVHANGVVHRDVKPGNVLLDAAGHARLSDFGIARLVDATRVTATGLVVGTAAYMAPEQVRGEVVGPPADVYALGLVLLEAATGRREFEGGALEAAIARLHRNPVVPPSVPEPLAATIGAMTAPDPADRPVATDVAAALCRRPVRRRPLEGPLARRLVSTGALASLVASAVAGVVLLVGADTSAEAPAESPAPVVAPEPVAAPPSTTTSPAVVDEPVAAVVPTPQRPAPVPVALARRNRPATVTRTVIHTVPEKAGRTKARPADPAKDDKGDTGDKGNKGDKGDKGKGDGQDKSKDDKPGDKGTPKDETKPDGTGGDQGGKTDKDEKGGDSGNSGKGNGNSGKGNGNSGKGNGNSGKGNGDD